MNREAAFVLFVLATCSDLVGAAKGLNQECAVAPYISKWTLV